MTSTTSTTPRPRAAGILRVSQPGKRDAAKLHSPSDQRAAIARLCEEQGWELVAVYDERKVSGNAPLEERPGLSQAVAGVMTGAVDVIVGAYAERLWWSHEVRAQVLRLAEQQGAEVWAVDAGRLTNGTAAEDFSAETRTSADRFTRRQNAEKAVVAVQTAITEKGRAPWSSVTPGYVRGEDGRFTPDDATKDAVGEAFAMRLTGATIDEIRLFLRMHGIERTGKGVTTLLRSRVVLGEIHFEGYEPNLAAHDPIVARDVWEAVQRVRVPRGRRAKSERLLARLRVLRCASCGRAMTVADQTKYRCPAETGECPARVTITAEIAEVKVWTETKRLLRELRGRATAEQSALAAGAEAVAAEKRLGELLDFYAATGTMTEPKAVEQVTAARLDRDTKAAEAERLQQASAALVVDPDDERLSVAERRDLMRATVVATVVPADGVTGADRITVKLLGQ